MVYGLMIYRIHFIDSFAKDLNRGVNCLPVVQTVPVQADVHAHSKLTLSKAVQVPEFWHGVDEQGPGAKRKGMVDC